MKKELIYVLICFLIFLGLLYFQINPNTFLQDATLDINVAHDTYIDIENADAIIFNFVFIFSFMYFLKVLYIKFKNRLTNYLYVVFNGLFIILSFSLIQLIYVLSKGVEINGMFPNEHFGAPFYLCITISITAILLEIYTIIRLRKQQ